MLVREAIGAVLRRERMRRGLTLRELSESARISLPYLSEIERGRKDPSSEIIAAIAPVLDLALADVVARATRELASAESASTERVSTARASTERTEAASVLDLVPVVDLTIVDVAQIAPRSSAEPQLLAA